MPTLQLTDRELQVVINALQLAATKYESYGRRYTLFQPRMAEQFDRQSSEARELAQKLEVA